MNENIVTTNRRSAADMCKSEGASIDFIKHPKKDLIFFTCGTVKGICSKNVQANCNTVEIKDLQVADMSVDGKPAVPILMMVGNSRNNVVRTLDI